MKTPPSRIFLSLTFTTVAVLLLACNSSPEAGPLKIAVNAGPEGEAIKKLAPQYPEGAPEIVEQPYESLREQLISVLASKKPTFDLVMVDDPWFPQLADRFIELKKVPKGLLDDFVEPSLALCRNPYRTGSLRALPFVGNTQLLFFRRDLLASLQVDSPPKDWKKVAQLSRLITETSESRLGRKVYGYTIRGRAGAPLVTDFLPVYWSLGGKLSNDPGSPNHEAIDTAKLVQALKIYKELKQASPPGAANYDWSEMTADFIAGNVVMELNWPAAIPDIDAKVARTGGKPGWAVSLPPGDAQAGTSMIGNWLLAVPSTSRRAKDAEALAIWLVQQQEGVVSELNPPTRKSVFAKMGSKPGTEHFNVIHEALQRSTPRDRTPLWAQMEDAVSRAVSASIAGTLTDEAAAIQLKKDIASILPLDTANSGK